MKYNFEATIALDGNTKDEINQTVEGLDVTGTVQVKVQVDAGTELGDGHLEVMKEKVSAALSARFGGQVEATMTGKEY